MNLVNKNLTGLLTALFKPVNLVKSLSTRQANLAVVSKENSEVKIINSKKINFLKKVYYFYLLKM